jgi:acetoin utilization deacetylase AcuC-like enzyme
VHGALGDDAVRRLGFPWSQELVQRSRASVYGTVAAARTALSEGVAGNLAGGTHHAFADHGEGYCVFNDHAVAIRLLQLEGLVERAVVVDLDVHQGNGTAAMFAGDDSVFTFSMHGAKNFPFRKERSSLDVELADGCRDSEYLAALEAHLPQAFDRARPDIVLLDNMTVPQLREAVEFVAGRAKTEASGGVTLDTVRPIAETGIDFVSVGALTHSARSLDVSLEVLP